MSFRVIGGNNRGKTSRVIYSITIFLQKNCYEFIPYYTRCRPAYLLSANPFEIIIIETISRYCCTPRTIIFHGCFCRHGERSVVDPNKIIISPRTYVAVGFSRPTELYIHIEPYIPFVVNSILHLTQARARRQ